MKTVTLTIEQLEDLRTHLIQKKIDIRNEIQMLEHQHKIASQLLDVLKLTIDEIHTIK